MEYRYVKMNSDTGNLIYLADNHNVVLGYERHMNNLGGYYAYEHHFGRGKSHVIVILDLECDRAVQSDMYKYWMEHYSKITEDKALGTFLNKA